MSNTSADVPVADGTTATKDPEITRDMAPVSSIQPTGQPSM